MSAVIRQERQWVSPDMTYHTLSAKLGSSFLSSRSGFAAVSQNHTFLVIHSYINGSQCQSMAVGNPIVTVSSPLLSSLKSIGTAFTAALLLIVQWIIWLSLIIGKWFKSWPDCRTNRMFNRLVSVSIRTQFIAQYVFWFVRKSNQ